MHTLARAKMHALWGARLGQDVMYTPTMYNSHSDVDAFTGDYVVNGLAFCVGC